MAIITLTSDWGTKDYYAAAVKGTILSMLPSATIVDVTHEIEPFNVSQAGFTLKNCYRCFPPGTIHIIAVDTIESMECPHVVVKAEGQYFISTDNGIFSHILDGKYDEAVCIDVMQDSDFFTFGKTVTRGKGKEIGVLHYVDAICLVIFPVKDMTEDAVVSGNKVLPFRLHHHMRAFR